MALVLAFVLAEKIGSYVTRWRYPCKYADLVEQWAEEYDLDPLLVYAFIRTESGFSAKAESDVGARGLMQITEETFLWLKSKIAPDEELHFSDLYDASVNIRFGAYYLRACLDHYSGDIATAAAAYHSGWGTVNTLLAQDAYSDDGATLKAFPYAQMNHYVNKITRTYKRYQELYGS
jgi:soluble lytic murein transglycosylase